MIQITYYVATSIDGYIAKKNGSVDWLSSVEMEDEDYGYSDFYTSIDGLLMGRNTFEKIQESGEWPYGKKACWVWSSEILKSKPCSVTETNLSPQKIIEKAKKKGLQNLWLVGGGKLAAEFNYKIYYFHYSCNTGTRYTANLWHTI
ncbi:Dihydrofolate reductase [hydrothermal vent metagenome]|uniref:Dihydrofolate reductase n=1 Tax=hydrothermal vent metagenome TaxID=652676 RepID=A0A3B0YBS2_9ZZZZ